MVIGQSYQLVSINLLTYNGQKYIKDCLNSVFSQDYPRLEILVIDNASTDETADYLRALARRPDLKIIFNQKNLGFSAGHNQAINQSRGEFICCLNQDVVLDKDFIKRAIEVFERDNRVAAVQGKLLRSGKTAGRDYFIDTTGLDILKNRRIISRGQGQIDQGQFEKMEEIFGADGAAPVYRKKALEDVKIFALKGNQDKGECFDEDFFAYKEDVDLAWRLRLYGWQAVYQPKAVAWHWRGSGESATKTPWGIIRERRKINQLAKYLAFKNQRLMQIKNESVWLLFKHLPWFLPKEIAAWLYVLFFEKYTWSAIKDLFKQMPRAWQKRKLIMAQKSLKAGKMERWFN